MIIDLNEFRPQNETHEHFFLKQVGRAYLFKQGIRCIATEVDGLISYDERPFGKEKYVIDVLGIDIRNKPDKTTQKTFNELHEIAINLAKEDGSKIVSPGYGNSYSWIYEFKLKGKELAHFKKMKEYYLEKACIKSGYDKNFHKTQTHFYKQQYQLRGIECKVSYSDYKNGYCILPEYTYLLAPKGVIPVKELPKKIGLLEFDFEGFHKDKSNDKEKWFKHLTVVKNPKKTYDKKFMEEVAGKSYFNEYQHIEFCQKVLFKISQQNTEEHIFWNPHLVEIDNTVMEKYPRLKYEYKIGDKTKLGLICDRKQGKIKGKEKKFFGPYFTNYYKVLQEGIGISKWMTYDEINKK